MSWFSKLWQKFSQWRVVRHTRRILQNWWDEVDENPYVVEILVPASVDLSTLKIGAIRGLLAVYTVSTPSPAGLKLISHWRSESAYEAYKASHLPIFANLGVPAGRTPTAEGHQQQAMARPPQFGWIQRHWQLVVAILATAAAIIGNVQKIGDPVLSIVVPPSVNITAPREALDVLAGEEFDTEFAIRNVSDWVSADVTIQAIRAQPPDAVALDTTVPGPFIGLKPGATETLKIHGVAKSSAPGGLVKTEVSFVGTASTYFQTRDLGAAGPQGQQFHLIVWPRRTVGVKHVGEVQGKRCRIDCQFMIGDEFAKGFEVQAQLVSPDDVRFDRIQFLGSPKLDWLPETQQPELIQVRWLAKDIKPRRRYQFSLYAKAQQDRTQQQWEAVVQRVTIDFGSPRAAK